MRIINGRNDGDSHGTFTFYNANGASLIDYVLIEESNFDIIQYFNSGVFNIFSDHSPVSFSMRYVKNRDVEIHNNVTAKTRTTIRWNEENKNDIVNAVQENINKLKEICDIHDYSEEGIDTFSRTIILPRRTKLTFKYKSHSSVCSKSKEDKPWFSDVCKIRWNEYRRALSIFNSCKSNKNRLCLIVKRKSYKRLEHKLKREYR